MNEIRAPIVTSIATLIRKLIGTYPYTLAEKWEVDSTAATVMEKTQMNIPTRALLERAREDLAMMLDHHGKPPQEWPLIRIGRAQDTLALLAAATAAQKPGDTVAVELPVDSARALDAWIADSPVRTVPDLDCGWDSIGDAVADALLAYDGPDGDDGRDFTPPYEP